MHIVCSDLEGVFIPEIWINVALKTGIEELKLTTRDISDYDALMRKRLDILHANNLKLEDITNVIATMEPLEGAVNFLDWLRRKTQVIILSDTFLQFAGPLIEKLGRPTLLCHELQIDADGCIADYCLRQQNSKFKAVDAFKNLNYQVIAMGDSYNDISMLEAAQSGILFRPPSNVVEEYPQFPVATTYQQLRDIFSKLL